MFLLGYSALAFFIPFINISPVLERNELAQNKLVQFIPPMSQQLNVIEQGFGISLWDWTFIVFSVGIIILLVKFIIQHVSFLRLRRSATLLLDAPVKLYQVDKEIIPFSFGDSIFINASQHSEMDLHDIIRHEFVHVKQKHSIDMLWSELLCILNWYNPFAWLIRKSIRQNLEFIADDKVVQNGIDKKQYQYLLLRVMGASQYSIATNFNFTSLKKRIAMMNKMKSAKVHLAKFLFVLPLIAVMLLSFRNQVSKHPKLVSAEPDQVASDTIPARAATPAKPVLPKNVKSIVSVNNQVTVTLKDGKTERYNLDKSEDKSNFESKYGSLPEPPTPPQPAAVSDITPPVPPAPPVVPSLPADVSGIHINNNKVVVKLKNGNVEKYDLDKADDKEKFEKKYGDIGAPPEKPVAPAAPVTPAAPAGPVTPVAPAKVTTMTVTGLEPTATVSIPPAVITTTLSADVVDLQHSVEAVASIKEEVIAEITNQTTSAELASLKKQLSVQGYRLDISNVSYNNGFIQSIEGTIADFTSKSRFLADQFSKMIILKTTSKNGSSGFNIRILNGTIRL